MKALKALSDAIKNGLRRSFYAVKNLDDDIERVSTTITAACERKNCTATAVTKSEGDQYLCAEHGREDAQRRKDHRRNA